MVSKSSLQVITSVVVFTPPPSIGGGGITFSGGPSSRAVRPLTPFRVTWWLCT